MSETFVIVGLGNPGPDYVGTRHNAGFSVIDLIAVDTRANYWKTECGALTAKVKYKDFDLILVKPQSFMNLSGGPVKQVLSTYKVGTDHLIVVHDELDIEPGTVRVKCGGGNAGHNGLKSITEKLGGPDWLRVRVGLGRPVKGADVADYVLSVPKKEQGDLFAQAQATARDAVYFLLENGLEKTQQKFN